MFNFRSTNHHFLFKHIEVYVTSNFGYLQISCFENEI